MFSLTRTRPLSYRERNLLQRQRRALIRSTFTKWIGVMQEIVRLKIPKWFIFLALGLVAWGLVALFVVTAWGLAAALCTAVSCQ